MSVEVRTVWNDTIGLNQFRKLYAKVDQVLNATTLRGRRSGSQQGGDKRRDLYEDCGYKQTEEITATDYMEAYERNPIAKKVVELYPNHCWRIMPSVYEDEDPEVITAFEQSWEDAAKSLAGVSWYKGEEGNPILSALHRASVLANIGHYGVLLLGVSGDEGADLASPLKLSDKGGPKARDLIYLKAFAETQATISSFDSDSSSPRYRLPMAYNLTFDDATAMKVTSDSVAVPVADAVDVHWTRVLHITRNGEVFHAPACRPHWNRLQDLEKDYGGSAEMFWQGAFPGLFFGTHPQLGGDVTVDTGGMKDMLEQYSNSLQRWLMMAGMDAKSLAPQVSDPTAQINVAIEAIAIGEDCPKRVFVGSERGELASDQDEKQWNETMVYYRHTSATPYLLAPLCNRLIQCGVLASPQEAYCLEWPESEKMTEDAKANRALKLTQAIAAFIASGGTQIMPLDMFFTRVLGFTLEETRSITEELEAPDYEDQMRTQQLEDEARRAEQQAEQAKQAAATVKVSTIKE